jgi:hypothetical protein
VDGGDGLQMWRVAANIFSKQLWMPNKGWPSKLGVGKGSNNKLTIKNQLVIKRYTLKLDGFFGMT